MLYFPGMGVHTATVTFNVTQGHCC